MKRYKKNRRKFAPGFAVWYSVNGFSDWHNNLWFCFTNLMLIDYTASMEAEKETQNWKQERQENKNKCKIFENLILSNLRHQFIYHVLFTISRGSLYIFNFLGEVAKYENNRLVARILQHNYRVYKNKANETKTGTCNRRTERVNVCRNSTVWMY